jgi:hypothetical protein
MIPFRGLCMLLPRWMLDATIKRSRDHPMVVRGKWSIYCRRQSEHVVLCVGETSHASAADQHIPDLEAFNRVKVNAHLGSTA